MAGNGSGWWRVWLVMGQADGWSDLWRVWLVVGHLGGGSGW